ncbi:hypothetical protein [Mycobacterium avium]|uniref:hypothetical protein n=1 Tax=Mycobacterium avium TaxID=1764 RepID=UPI0007A0D2F3|nr:hypothetical protein [Mycobacterium avium]MBZ4508551.1 hypothetical protein [Mycobacterium avium subsp. hominissuis]MBZ4516304.1 hypothetical protein [Mycobacterium avium subsp. hominissuis]MBZ4546145.1 hypothetical protein [Mycobacterium avium subsp. hominissuis]MBZ4554337.1 hypothetical protein [Mycobacterium avium subsp. hominissuis]MBZ4564222.1 hypothetical protein [Mycobacterium avium subsp. hominissuis]
MTTPEYSIDEVQREIFGTSGAGPERVYVELFAKFMRWPVDKFVLRSVSDTGRTEHHVTWVKGQAIGVASYVRRQGDIEMTAEVRTLNAVCDVKLHGTVSTRGFNDYPLRSISLNFPQGDPIAVAATERQAQSVQDQAEAFIDQVLDSLASTTAIARTANAPTEVTQPG